MGKLLVSGNGKKQMAGIIVQLIVFIAGVAIGVYMFSLSAQARRSEQSTLLIIGAVLLMTGGSMCITILMTLCKYRSKINVFEDRIEGNGIEKSLFTLQNFKMAYDQISNVDIIGNSAIVVYTSNAKYKCFVSNGAEIRDTIFKIKNT